MSPAGWSRVGLTWAWLAVALSAAEAPTRAAPRRPGAASAAATAAAERKVEKRGGWDVSSRRVGNVEGVELARVAEALGLAYAWSGGNAKAVLTGEGARAELPTGTRDVEVNGLRVFLGQPVMVEGGKVFVSRTDFERVLAPLLRPGTGVTPIAKPKTIVLDPGHGGKDHGTSVNEKTYALDVARRAKPLLEAAGFRVVLTRTEDVFIGKRERAILANTNRADVFVSIHFNALPKDTKTSGIEIFSFAPRGQRSTDSWSPGKTDDAESAAAAVNRWDYWSSVLAQALQGRLVRDLQAFDRGKKIAHWGVLRGLNCPGVLVECGFLTSETEAKKIATEAYRQRLAETLAAGVQDYARVVASGTARGR